MRRQDEKYWFTGIVVVAVLVAVPLAIAVGPNKSAVVFVYLAVGVFIGAAYALVMSQTRRGG